MVNISITLNGDNIINFDDLIINKDFFNPIHTVSFKLKGPEDVEQVRKTTPFAKIVIKIEDTTVFFGNLDDKSYSISPTGGTICELTGRNPMGYVADSVLFPGIQNNFKIGMNYEQVFKTIFEPFDIITVLSGQPKSDAALKKLLTAQLKTKHVLNRHEGCLELAIRFAKRSGLFINVAYDLSFPEKNITAAFLISPDYSNSNPFKIDKYKSFNLKLDTSKQPTILIANGKPVDGVGYKPVPTTSAFVNEITGFNFLSPSTDLQPTNFFGGGYGSVTTDPIFAVKEYINKYKLQKAIGKPQEPFSQNQTFGVPANIKFVNQIYGLFDTNRSDICRPYYWYDDNSTTAAEIKISGQMKLHDFQRQFFSCNLLIDGFKDNTDNFFDINSMIDLENININNIVNIKSLWISKLTYNYSRSGGSTTNLTLNLPFIYDDVN